MFLVKVAILVICLTSIYSKFHLTLPAHKSVEIENPFYFILSEQIHFQSEREGNVVISSQTEFLINDVKHTSFSAIEKSELRKSYTIGLEVGSKITIENRSEGTVQINCGLTQSRKKLIADLGAINNLGISYTYEFAPNSPLSFSNPLFFAVSGTCSVKSPDTPQTAFGIMKKGKGKLNGNDIPKEGLSLDFKAGDVFKVYGGAFSEVEITNKGTVAAVVECSLGDSSDFKRMTTKALLNHLKMIESGVKYLSNYKTQRGVKVIVIGAGVSGIKAAETLESEGINVKILEARDRIGGRVWSSNKFGYPLDFGASWIHGHKDNEIYDLAEKYDVRTIEFNYEKKSTHSSTLTKEELLEVLDESESVENKILSFIQKKQKDIETDISLEEAFREYERKTWFISKVEKTILYNYLRIEFESEYGNRADDLSLFYYDEGGELRGEDYVMPDGYIKIFEPIAKDLDIELNTEVLEINQTDSGVVCIDKNGNSHEADYVIVTVPLGFLKKDLIKFTPELSDRKKQAIQNHGMGVLEKVYIEFTEVFWEKDSNVISILELPVNLIAYMINFYNVTGKPVLLIFVAGNGKYFPEYYTSSEEELLKIFVKKLSTYYPGKNIEVKQSYMTNWKNDQYAFGTYSSYTPKSTPKDVIELAKNEGKVYFAGEHTYVKFPQTVHGAYLSGDAAAKAIIRDID